MSDDKKKTAPMFNSGLGAAILIDDIIRSACDALIEQDYNNYYNLLLSWYSEILPLANKKAVEDNKEKEEPLHKDSSTEEIVKNNVLRAKKALTINDLVNLEKCKTGANSEKNVFNLQRFHHSLGLVTDKLGLRMKDVSTIKGINWMSA